MARLEFGQDRLTQSHPLNTFELAQGASNWSIPHFIRYRFAMTAHSSTARAPESSLLHPSKPGPQ